MQFSTIRNFTLAVLAGSALALPAVTEDAGSVANVEVSQVNVEVSQSTVFARNSVSMEKLSSEQAPAMLEKRIVPAIVLLKVIGGKLFAGAISAAIERAKDALAPSVEGWKDFDQVS